MNVVLVFALLLVAYSVAGFGIGLYQTRKRQNPYGLCPWFNPLGAFVFGDAVVFGALWMGLSLSVIVFPHGWWLGLVASVFWWIRAGGEVLYWLLQQFSETKRDKPKDLTNPLGFPGESIYFAYQIFWQSVMVVSTLSALYFIRLWWG